MTQSGNRTRATLVGGECSHHCAIPASEIMQLYHLRDIAPLKKKRVSFTQECVLLSLN